MIQSPVVPGQRPASAVRTPRRALATGLVLILAAAVIAPGPASGQASWSPTRAGALLADRQWAEALALADDRLSAEAEDRDAVGVRVVALIRLGRGDDAVSAYEAFRKSLTGNAAEIEAAMARAALGRLVDTATTAETRVDAIEALARAGDEESRRSLESLAKEDPPTPASWNATAALARLGDKAARTQVARGITADRVPMQLMTLRALKRFGAEGSLDAVATGLRSPEPVVQGAAAEVAAAFPDKVLIPALRSLIEKGRSGAPLWAALALWRLGDRAGEKLLVEALAAPFEDGRLVAAQAFPREQPVVLHALRQILGSENPLYRINAAELLTPRVEAARQVLYESLQSENQLVRGEAMRVLAADRGADPALLRWGFRDWSPTVQLEAAKAILVRQDDDGPASRR